AFADLVAAHDDLRLALASPAIPAARKRAVVAQLRDRQQPSGPVRKLLLLLAERDRLELLADLVSVFHERVMEHLKVVQAEVTTAPPLPPDQGGCAPEVPPATPLPPDQVAQLQQRLGTTIGRTVTLTTRVDPALIGGMVT